MNRLWWALLAAACSGLLAMPGVSQTPMPSPRPKSPSPRLVPVAETKLIMEGINQPNFQGLEKLLQNKDLDAEGWKFARGQALLIAESGNLLMLRPPRNSGEGAWMKAGTELRDTASSLARSLASRELLRSRAGLTQLANTCNKCHQAFNIQTRISAFSTPSP